SSPYARPVTRRPQRSNNPVLYLGAALVLVAIGCLVAGYVFLVKPEMAKHAQSKDLKALLHKQPDFRADCSGVEGDFDFAGKMARHNDQFLLQVELPRSEIYNQLSRSGTTPISAIISPNGNIQIVVPEVRAYIEVPRGTQGMPKGDPIQDL